MLKNLETCKWHIVYYCVLFRLANTGEGARVSVVSRNKNLWFGCILQFTFGVTHIFARFHDMLIVSNKNT